MKLSNLREITQLVSGRTEIPNPGLVQRPPGVGREARRVWGGACLVSVRKQVFLVLYPACSESQGAGEGGWREVGNALKTQKEGLVCHALYARA